MSYRSKLLEVEEMKLKLYSKNGNTDRHYQFQKWFLSKADLYTTVDKELSQKVSDSVKAKIKECYYNCWKAVNDREFNNLDYCEGFVISDDLGIPFEHCWLTDPRGVVIDPTLIISGLELEKQLKKYGNARGKKGKIRKWLGAESIERKRTRVGSEYLGINFKKLEVNKFATKTKKAGTYLYLLFEGDQEI